MKTDLNSTLEAEKAIHNASNALKNKEAELEALLDKRWFKGKYNTGVK